MGPEPASTPPVAAARRPWLAPAGLVLLMGGLFFLRLGQDLPLRSHEALVAETARNMFLQRPVQLADGSRPSPYLVPNCNGVPRLRKTPLAYWMVAGLAHVTGAVDEWTARLPSALAAVGTVLVMVTLLRRWTDRRTALWGGAALVTTIGFLLIARTALSDMPMTFLATAALAALWLGVETGGGRRFGWLALSGTAAGLAMLAKGPAPALVFPLPCLAAAGIMVARLVRARRAGGHVRTEWTWTIAGAAVAVLLFLAVVLPWAAYLYVRVPEALALLKAESVDRSTGDYGHQEPLYFYVVRLPVLVAPWTVFFVYGLVLAARRMGRGSADRPWLLFLGAWLVGPLAAFSVAAGKQDHYILPILPAAAGYAALAIRAWVVPGSPGAERTGRRVLAAHGILTLLLGLAVVAPYAVWRMDAALISTFAGAEMLRQPAVLGPVVVLGALGLVGGMAAVVLALRRRLAGSLACLVATFAAAFLWAWPALMGPMDRATPAEKFATHVRHIVPRDVPLHAFVSPNNTVVFYIERSVPSLARAADVQHEVARGRPFFLMCAEKYRPALGQVRGLVPLVREADPYRPDEGFWLFQAPGTPPPT